MDINYDYLINFRQSIHQNPELSGNEEYTSEALKRTILRYHPDQLIDSLGGFGLAFVFNGKESGPSIMFRADMDALPIAESNNVEYASRVRGVGHHCGHDGHMAILLGLIEYVSHHRPKRGRVIMLFQPAEETGEGAQAVMNDPEFAKITPDFVFSLHNIPGYPKNSLIIKNRIFSAASKGITVKLSGKTVHASEPEKGISPAVAMAKIIESISNLPSTKYLFKEFVLTTVTYARMGTPFLGTAPGDAEIMITLRSYNDQDMNTLLEHCHNIIYLTSNEEGLKTEIKISDIYPVMNNDGGLSKNFTDLAEDAGYTIFREEKPFPWAEDFARFSTRYKSFIFGLGAGEETPMLHNSDYDFPDDIIPKGIEAYTMLYNFYLVE